MISEERQRKVYEWAYPEFKVRDWTLMGSRTGEPWAHWPGHFQPLSKQCLPALYLKDSSGNMQPNYQWFFTEAVPKLLKVRCSVGASFLGRESDAWWIERWGDRTLGMNIDPIAALADYVEAQCLL